VDCDNIVLVPPHLIKRKKYCSRACVNEAKKGRRISQDTEFRLGNRPKNWKPVGTISVRHRERSGKSHAWVKTAEPNVWKPRAVVVWEEERGPILLGMFPHHKDGDSLNDDIDNLRLVDRTAHLTKLRPKFEEKRKTEASIVTKYRWRKYRYNKGRKNHDVAIV
jgi:hypothetical protein